jgi:hypothetical protein
MCRNDFVFGFNILKKVQKLHRHRRSGTARGHEVYVWVEATSSTAVEGDGSSARNSSARKPAFQANLQISLVVFENMYGR